MEIVDVGVTDHMEGQGMLAHCSSTPFEASSPPTTNARREPGGPESLLDVFSSHTLALWSLAFGCRLANTAAFVLNPEARGSSLLVVLNVLAAALGVTAGLSVASDAGRAMERGYWTGYARCAVDLLGERRRQAAPGQRAHRPSLRR